MANGDYGRRFEAGEDVNAGMSNEIMNNWGAYSQVCWDLKEDGLSDFAVIMWMEKKKHQTH
ncbi:hypothetical protein [Candidatus Kuenenia stuttgartiensis]|uniref:hypothetical protein n=1 Tax=Kuenenia stuttgartiensis TaxID=174633 RepID=UPI00146F15DA|nr:hypothetical protein [Candidatus Kuenenia stuttgartiensis]